MKEPKETNPKPITIRLVKVIDDAVGTSKDIFEKRSRRRPKWDWCQALWDLSHCNIHICM